MHGFLGVFNSNIRSAFHKIRRSSIIGKDQTTYCTFIVNQITKIRMLNLVSCANNMRTHRIFRFIVGALDARSKTTDFTIQLLFFRFVPRIDAII